MSAVVEHLHCPTCGKLFYREMRREEEPDWSAVPADITLGSSWYLLCTAGHRWSVKTIWRRENEPDEVLLGRYLGPQEVTS